MKRIIFITIWLSLLGIAACAPRPGDPAATILPNQQRALELLGKWKLTQLQSGNTPQPHEIQSLTFQKDGQLQIDLWEHRLTYKYEVAPDPDHLRLTWIASTNPNDKPGAVLTQPFAMDGLTLTLNGAQYQRSAFADGATLTPAPRATAPPTARAAAQVVHARLNETFELRGGQSVELTDAPTRLGVTFARLVSDQRCPQDMACYWAGEARLQISFSEDGMEHPPLFELTTNQHDPQRKVRLTARQAYEVELLALEPPRKTGAPIPFEQYVATFRVTHTAPTAILAASPTSVAPTTARLDEPFTLKMFQTITLPEAQMQLTLNKLLEDSRCPAKVRCVWAGRAALGLAVERGDRLALLNMSTMPPDGSMHAYFQGYAFELLDVQPYPQNSGDQIPPAAYSAKMVVRKMAPPSVVHKNEPIVLKSGQSARLADENVTVTFARVAQDSRCPYRATCATRGDGIVEAILTQADGTTQTFVLHTDSAQRNTRTPDTGPYGIKLLALTPYPTVEFASQEIAPAEYEATFVVREFASAGPTKTPGAPTASACAGLTRADAESILGEPALPEASNQIIIRAAQEDSFLKPEAYGLCGYVSKAFAAQAPPAPTAPRLESSAPADYAVIAGRVTGADGLALLRVANILYAANPNADDAALLILKTSLAAGDWDAALDKMQELAQGVSQITTDAPQMGERALWVWYDYGQARYAALIVQETPNSYLVIQALVSDKVTQAGIKAAMVALASR